MDATDLQNDDATDQQNDEGAERTKSPPKKKNVRGATRLSQLVKNNNVVRKQIMLNHLGQPKRKKQEDFQSYLALMTKLTIPIIHETWQKVPESLKDKLWASVESRYDIDISRKHSLLVGCGDNWRTWKSRLTTKWILPLKDQPEKLKNPPPLYPYIKQEHWDAFVKTRCTEDFQVIHDTQSERRSQNVYNHRTGRSGYTGLMENLVESGEYTIEEIDRVLLWKKARQSKGEYKDDVVKEKADEIDKYIQNHQAELKNDNTDALTSIFGEDTRGKVRAAGKYVTPTTFFNIPRRRSTAKKSYHAGNEELLLKHEELSKENADLKARLLLLEQKYDGLTNRDQSSVASHQQNARPTNSESAKSPDPKKSSARSPRSKNNLTQINKKNSTPIKKKFMSTTSEFAKNHEPKKLPATSHHQSAMPPTSALGLGMGQPCKLYIGSKHVATGNVYPSKETDKLHTVPLGKNNYRVEVKFAKVSNAPLPVPVLDEMHNVGEAIGSHVAWPKKNVIFEKSHEDTTSPDVFKQFFSQASNSVDGSDILLILGADVFSAEKDADFYLSLDDISYICESSLASIVDIVLYIRFLHERIVLQNKQKKFGFLNPVALCSSTNFEHLCAEMLKGLTKATTEFVFVPFVRDSHWVLMVVKLEIMKIWWLDPLGQKERFCLEDVMKCVVRGSGLVGEKKKLKDPVWYSPPSTPKQTGGWECGYYVMRYMKEIIEEKPNPITTLKKFAKTSYNEEDINEVRLEWIKYLEQYL